MIGAQYYGTGDSIQYSFKYASHTNLSIGASAATTSALTGPMVFLSLAVAAHIKVGSGDATTSDFMLPPGMWPLVVTRGQTISVIQLSGGSAGQASVIVGEEA